jgi:hypothetical protein
MLIHITRNKSIKQVKNEHNYIDHYYILCFTLWKQKQFPVQPRHEYQPAEAEVISVPLFHSMSQENKL